jgi:hypothetical protein
MIIYRSWIGDSLAFPSRLGCLKMFVKINIFLLKNDPDPTATDLPKSLLLPGPPGISFA